MATAVKRRIYYLSTSKMALVALRTYIVVTYSKCLLGDLWLRELTRRPPSADRTARRQFQATGQPESWTQASHAMTPRLPRYEAKCVQRRCFQCGSVPLRSNIMGTELPPANILIPLERQLIALQLAAESFYIMKLCSRLSSIIVEIVQKTTNLGTLSPF